MGEGGRTCARKFGECTMARDATVEALPNCGIFALRTERSEGSDAAGSDQDQLSEKEKLLLQQKHRRLRRKQIIAMKRSGAHSIASTDSFETVQSVNQFPPHLNALEVRKLKNRQSAARSRNRKLELIASLTKEVSILDARYAALLQENAHMRAMLSQDHRLTPPMQACTSIPQEVVIDDSSSCSSLSSSPSPSLRSFSTPAEPVTALLLPASFDIASCSAASPDFTSRQPQSAGPLGVANCWNQLFDEPLDWDASIAESELDDMLCSTNFDLDGQEFSAALDDFDDLW